MGTAILLMVCTLCTTAPTILQRLFHQNTSDFSQYQAEIAKFEQLSKVSATIETNALFVFDPNTATFEQLIQLGISEKTAGSICRYREKGGHFTKPEDFKKIYSLSADTYKKLEPFIQIGVPEAPLEQKNSATSRELFTFDPNIASASDLLKLGLSQSAVKGIIGYRSKGGVFRQKEDLQKIYALHRSEYERVAPFFSINSDFLAQSDAVSPATYHGGTAMEGTKKLTGPVDINRSPLESWQQLPGIGEKRARQILNFREKLGGFISIDQVGETMGLPDSTFKKIKPLLVLETTNIRKINLNTASIDDLDAHPYCAKQQAMLLVQFREQNGPFTSINDLDKIAVFSDPKWLSKIKPYLDVR
jgi:competence ComEA-like helix-hairpin-helix protein